MFEVVMTLAAYLLVDTAVATPSSFDGNMDNVHSTTFAFGFCGADYMDTGALKDNTIFDPNLETGMATYYIQRDSTRPSSIAEFNARTFCRTTQPNGNAIDFPCTDACIVACYGNGVVAAGLYANLWITTYTQANHVLTTEETDAGYTAYGLSLNPCICCTGFDLNNLRTAPAVSGGIQLSSVTLDPPTPAPTLSPTQAPTESPTASPTSSPTQSPTAPTSAPTSTPTKSPTSPPTLAPTSSPTRTPTAPTSKPTSTPTKSPTSPPTLAPTTAPTSNPTPAPTAAPTLSPTSTPTKSPTPLPTSTLTAAPTLSPPTPTPTTAAPTLAPTTSPTLLPTTASPTSSPTTASPTSSPTLAPTTSPTSSPTTASPTSSPTLSPTNSPTQSPTLSPTQLPTRSPTQARRRGHTASPTHAPNNAPTMAPTGSPTVSPTEPTSAPTTSPTTSPTTGSPTASPTSAPTTSPTAAPTEAPTKIAHAVTVTSVDASNYVGAVKIVYEVAYGMAIHIWDHDASAFAAGCSVLSAASSARRSGTTITFSATVHDRRAGDALDRALGLAANASQFTDQINAAKSAVSETGAYDTEDLSEVPVPNRNEVTAQSPVISTLAPTAAPTPSLQHLNCAILEQMWIMAECCLSADLPATWLNVQDLHNFLAFYYQYPAYAVSANETVHALMTSNSTHRALAGWNATQTPRQNKMNCHSIKQTHDAVCCGETQLAEIEWRTV